MAGPNFYHPVAPYPLAFLCSSIASCNVLMSSERGSSEAGVVLDSRPCARSQYLHTGVLVAFMVFSDHKPNVAHLLRPAGFYAEAWTNEWCCCISFGANVGPLHCPLVMNIGSPSRRPAVALPTFKSKANCATFVPFADLEREMAASPLGSPLCGCVWSLRTSISSLSTCGREMSPPRVLDWEETTPTLLVEFLP